MNITLTVAESLFWGISDVIQVKCHEVDHKPTYSMLWVHLLREVLHLCDDPRPEVQWA
jgi:hypothetical protein